MNISLFADRRLFDDLRELVPQEREMLVVILRYIGEIDSRSAAVDRGYPSTFAYCTEELRYSEAEAICRIRTARLVREHPGVLDDIEAGSMSMTVAARAQTCFQRELVTEETPAKRRRILEELRHRTTREADRILAVHYPGRAPEERRTYVDGDLLKLQFAIGRLTEEKMEKIFGFRSHKNPGKRLDLLFEDLLNLGLRHWDPMRPRRRRKQIS